MAPWLRFLEAFLVQQLLRTPAFHRAVEKVARGVHRLRHGIPPEEAGGTKIDGPGNSSFLRAFTDEIKAQLGSAAGKEGGKAGVHMDGRAMSHQGTKRRAEKEAARADEMDAEAAWRESKARGAEPPKQGFLGEYVEALRQQVRGDKKR
jgi:hypothetical protein